MTDESIHVNFLDCNIIQTTARSIATIARKSPFLLQVIRTPVLCLSPFHPVLLLIARYCNDHTRPDGRDTVGLFPGVAPHICLEQVWMQHDLVIGNPFNEEIIQAAVRSHTAIGMIRQVFDAPIRYVSFISDYSHFNYRQD